MVTDSGGGGGDGGSSPSNNSLNQSFNNNNNSNKRGGKMIKTLSKFIPARGNGGNSGGGGGGGGGGSSGGGNRPRASSYDSNNNEYYGNELDNPNNNNNNNNRSRSSYKPPTPTRSTRSTRSRSTGRNSFVSFAHSTNTTHTANTISREAFANTHANANRNTSRREQKEVQKRTDRHHRKNVKRYRGFSTSISSLFLDEQVVCGAISWCGLLASSRTERLLEARDESLKHVKTNGGEEKSPSRVLGLLLIASVSFISLTYLIWGFGENVSDGEEYNYKYYGRVRALDNVNADVHVHDYGYDDTNMDDHNDMHMDDDQNTNIQLNNVLLAKKYYVPGVMRFCDYDRRFWSPIATYIWKMVKVPPIPSSLSKTSTKTAISSSSLPSSMTSSSSLTTLFDSSEYTNQPSNSQHPQTPKSQIQPQIQPQQTTPHKNIGKRQLSNWMDDQQLASDLRLLVCLIFLIVLGLFGRRRRMRTRFAVLKARTHDDQIHFGGFKKFRIAGIGIGDDAAATAAEINMKREDKYAGACSHTLCGCYPIDRKVIKASGTTEFNEEDDEIAPGLKKKNEDSINKAFTTFMSCCFGNICQLWCQCFSICALAQEAREVRLLVPPKLQRIDFITHQPWKEYFTDIYDLRVGWKNKERRFGMNRRLGSHLGALSSLSRSIVAAFVIATSVIIITEQFNPRAIFSWADACVLIMTFLQSFIVVGVVHGMFHKSDLSLDAVVKFFAAGFIIATPTAFVFELLVMTVFGLFYYIIGLVIIIFVDEDDLDFGNVYFRFFMLLTDTLQSFLIAALVEELCKYYAFRTVEHPDLIFLTGLNRVKRDYNSSYGGNNEYAFSSDNNALLSRVDTFESEYSRTSNSRRNHRGHSHSPGIMSGRRKKKSMNNNESEEDVRTVRQKAAAVTTAMISVAVGLACAENFIYVFFFSGSNSQDKMTMLLFRSVFPVHALCAAMQSIGVIEKFLEESDDSVPKSGVGSIVFPAIMLHGSFDSVLMMINSFIDYAVENAENQGGNGGNNFFMLDVIAAIIVFSAMIAGFVWYHVMNRVQKAKLKLLEGPSDDNAVDGSRSFHDNEGGIELL